MSEWIGPATQGQLTFAWRFDAVRRMKRLPSKPSDLYREKGRVMTDAQMYRHVTATMAEVKKAKAAEERAAAKKPKTGKK